MNKTFHMLLGVSFALSPIASAFSQETETTEAEKSVERIQVTGSNIKGIDLEGAQPLTVITADDIARSGASSVSELLKDLGATRGGEGSFSTSESGALSTSTPAGQSAVSLRGLGAASTLTLVNGRRVAASSFAAGTQNFVDVSSIPVSAIERIEVLATGASATYGADAVAGVVNYILKKNYEGAELDITLGNSTASSDDGKYNVNFLYGKNFGDSNITLYGDYFKRNPLFDRDRSETRDSIQPSQSGIFPSFNVDYFDFTPQGPYFSGNIGEINGEEFDPDTGEFIGEFDVFVDDLVEAACPSDLQDFGRFGEFCRYNQNAFLPTIPEFESHSLGFMHNTDFGDTVWFTDFMYSKTESSANSTGASFEYSFPNNLFFVPTNHPDFPAELQDRFNTLWSELGVTDIDQLVLFGRFADPRTIEAETKSWRFVSGLEGEYAGWTWEAAVNIARSESEQRAIAGIANKEKFIAALAGELCADGTTNCTPGTDGLYYPIFGGQANDPNNVKDLVFEQVPRNGESTVYGLDLKTSGELFEFGDDVISAAFGLEWRKEEIEDTPSPLATADPNDNFDVDVIGFGSSAAKADRTQWAAFAEFFVPVTDSLDLQLAGRYDHYDDFGGDFNPKATIKYSASDDLVLRASWASSFRAPSLTQAGVELRTTTYASRCINDPLFQKIYCDDGSEFTGNSVEYGNPELQAEEAESFNAGIAWSLNDDITLTVDYWRFEHEKIVDVDAESMFLAALDDPALIHCGPVPVGSFGVSADDRSDFCFDRETDSSLTIRQFDAAGGIFASRDLFFTDTILQLVNTGNQETDGLDITYTHYIDTKSLGSFTLLLDATKVFSFDRQRSGLAEDEELAGSFRYPDLIASAKVRWSYEDWFASVSAHFTDGYDDEPERLRTSTLFDLGLCVEAADGGDDCSLADEQRVSSWTVVDANLGYYINDNATVSLSVNNLFDRDAPRVFGTSANVDHRNHDTMGTYYNLNFTYTF